VVLGLVLDGWNVTEGAMQAGFVEPVDPVQRGQLEVVDTAPGSFVAHAFGLVEPDPALGHRVVIGVTDRPDRGQSAGIEQPGGVPDRGVATTG
jgi:hypothetical protein